MKNSKSLIYGSVILAMIFWSLSFVWYKVVYLYFTPISVIILRLVISSLFLLFISIILNKLQKIKGGDFRMFLLLAFLEPFMYFMGESFGVNLVSSTVAAVIISTIPLFCPIAAYFLQKESLTIMNFIGILVSLCGVVLMVLNNQFKITVSIPGVFLLFLAVFSAVFYSVVSMRLTAKYNVLTIITYQNVLGLLYFLPLLIIFELDNLRIAEFTIKTCTPLIELAVFASSLAFICFTYSLKHLGISKANVFVYLIPVFTAIFAYILIKEELSVQKIIGIFIAVCGLFISQLKFSYPAFLFSNNKQRLS